MVVLGGRRADALGDDGPRRIANLLFISTRVHWDQVFYRQNSRALYLETATSMLSVRGVLACPPPPVALLAVTAIDSESLRHPLSY